MKHVDKELLVKYVAGECTPAEKARVEAAINQDPAVQTRVERLRQVWQTCRSAPTEWDVEAGWEEFRARICSDRRHEAASFEGRSADDRGHRPSDDRRRTSRSQVRRWVRTAGVAALLLVATVVALHLSGEELSYVAGGDMLYATQEGERTTIKLLDGTQIHLNVATKLVIDGDYGGESREVRLDGEAYFEVESDSARPFIVQTEEARVEVRGTKFNVTSYAEDKETAVAVTEGEVAMEAQQSTNTGSQTLLGRHVVGVVTEQGDKQVRPGAELSSYLAWIDGRLVFEDASFERVERKLERWYGLDVTLDIQPEAIVGLNAAFEDESIDEVLQTISVALDLKYHRERDKVTFYR